MTKLRKTIKAYLIAICVFIVLTLILAALIKFTGYPESWSFGGLIAALSLSTLLLGTMEGRIIEKKGLLTGFASAVLFILAVRLAAAGIFAGDPAIGGFDLMYGIPVLTGIAGGVVGANGGKS